jgi:purine nucleosidase
MQFPGAAPPSVGVLFDSAFDRIDDLLALALLYGLDGKSEMRMSAVTVSRPDFAAAQFCDIVKRFYTGAAGGFGFGASFPVGLAADAQGKPQTKPLAVYPALLAKTTDDGAPLYKPAIENFLDTADPATVLRNALTASQPHNTIVIAGGPLTSLARLMELRGSKDLIALNVRYLAIAAGPWIAADANAAKAAQRVFDDWPTPIYACSVELGAAVRFPASSIDKDFAWSKAHPVADAYRAFASVSANGAPYDAPTSTMDAALYAIRPDKGYFKLSGPGLFRASAAGVEFTASAQGKHQLLMPDEAQTGAVVKALTELASAQPVVRARRGPRADAKTDPNADKTQPVKKQ